MNKLMLLELIKRTLQNDTIKIGYTVQEVLSDNAQIVLTIDVSKELLNQMLVTKGKYIC